MPLALADPIIPHFPSSREELAIFVKAGGHDPVRGVECFFDAVTVMHVDVDIQDSMMIPFPKLALSGHILERLKAEAHRRSSNMPRTISRRTKPFAMWEAEDHACRSHSKSRWPPLSSHDAVLQPS